MLELGEDECGADGLGDLHGQDVGGLVEVVVGGRAGDPVAGVYRDSTPVSGHVRTVRGPSPNNPIAPLKTGCLIRFL